MKETPVQSLNRLLTAVETLAAEEEVLLRTGEYAAAAGLAQRMQSVVDRLCELATSPALAGRIESSLRARAAALVERRIAGAELLTTRMAEVKARLRVNLEAQTRASQLQSVYRFRGTGDFAATG